MRKRDRAKRAIRAVWLRLLRLLYREPSEVWVQIETDAEALQRVANAAKNSGVSLKELAKRLNAVNAADWNKPKREWWETGDEPPDFVIDVNKPEWWQLGDDEPPYGQAV